MTGTLTKKQTLAVAQPVPYDLYQVTAPVNRQNRAPGDPCHTLARDNAAHAAIVQKPMAFSVCPDHCGGDKSGQDFAFVNVVDVSRTLDCTGADVSRKQGGIGIATAMQVRRLTPVEYERLQGFPDNYTAIPWRNKTASECPDGPRYKALGNSMAVPVMRWIGQQLDKAK